MMARFVFLLAGLLMAALCPELLIGQATTPAATDPQMRHFWHVFAAYAIVWILLFGWLVSIARRMKRVEERLGS